MSDKKYTVNCQDYQITINDLKVLPDIINAKQYSNIFTLTDDNTSIHCLPIISEILAELDTINISLPHGEMHKNLDSCKEIWEAMLSHNADRKSLVLNIGGGVIGDMGGFAATCYMRGIDFIQVPTTLLSQVDASVGGKLGVDFKKYKNLIGAFSSPRSILVYPPFLKTLTGRELRSGFAEIIKHALIYSYQLWAAISTKSINDIDDWATLVYKNILIKKEIVEIDPFEGGLRKILNFGHTIGHGIESHLLGTEHHLLHGEAIAIGMITEAYLSNKKTGLSNEALQTIESYILNIYDDLPKKLVDKEQIIANLEKDKKNESGKKMFSLLKEIGNCTYNVEVNNDEIIEALTYYNQLR